MERIYIRIVCAYANVILVLCECNIHPCECKSRGIRFGLNHVKIYVAEEIVPLSLKKGSFEMFATVHPESSFGGYADYFDVTLADGRKITMTAKEMLDYTEADEVVKLLCGETIQFHLSDKFIASYEAYEAEIAAQEKDVAMNERLTQEYIMEHKMLHGYDPREDW
jgi:hypothetical protein